MSSAHSIDPTQDHFDECKFMRSLELSYSEGSYQTTGDDLLDSIMFGPCSTPLIERNVSEQSGTGTGSTRSSKTSQWTKGTDDDTFKVSHGGKTYPDVKRKDLERSILSRRMNRLVPSHEYDLFRQQQRKDTEGIKKTIRSLAGQADWPQFRKQCKDLVDAVENNTELGSDLKTLLKNELRDPLQEGAASQICNMIGATPEVQRLLIDEGYDTIVKRLHFWQSTMNSPESTAALCGWPVGDVPHQVSPFQGTLLGMAKVDIETSGCFKIKDGETA